MTPGLYIVPTPIGNLQDITYRAVEVLTKADYIYCEDTRVTAKLLSKYGIKSTLRQYQDFSENQKKEEITSLASSGKIIALVSDAGTPLISDPGYKLVNHFREQGLYYTVLPGASSVITGLVLSGEPTDSFLFAGFAPKKVSEMHKFFSKIKSLEGKGSFIFFETAGRIDKTLEFLIDNYGSNLQLSITRELSKKFEEVLPGTAAELLNKLNQKPIKGELVVIINASSAQETEALSLDSILSSLDQSQSAKDLTRQALSICQKNGLKVSKSDIYKKVLELK